MTTELKESEVSALRRACQCLFVQVPEDIARDVQRKAEVVIKLLDARSTDYRRVLEPIVACYGLGLSPEKFADQVGPWIMEARALLTTKQGAPRRLYEAKLLGFGDKDRIRLCAACHKRAVEDDFVIFSCALPAPPVDAVVDKKESK